MQLRKAWSGGVALVVLLVTPCLAHGPMPTEWPLERIIANLEGRLRVDPDDAQAHYSLGRAHGFAFALERTSLWATENRDHGPWVEDLEDQVRRAKASQAGGQGPSDPLSQHERSPSAQLEHLGQGVQHLRKACEIKERGWWRSRWHLTLAWLLETGAHLADRVDPIGVFDLPTDLTSSDAGELRNWIDLLGSGDAGQAEAARKALATTERLRRALPLLSIETASSNAGRQRAAVALLQRYWLEQAIEHYRIALEVSIADMGTVRDENRMAVAREARDSLMRLVQARGYRDDVEEESLAGLQERMKEIESLKNASRGVTPILLSVDGCRPLDELLAEDLAVPFDLNGDAVDELWPWIAPGTGWLVWDPEQRGEILSGLQLFGSASAWLFYEDGYRVLDSLDDDRDGALRGAELAGIAVWFDRDADGVSDRGEVVPVEELGIVALATQAALTVGASPANLCGLELADGRVLPTYDWVLAPVTGL